jgi:Acetyltransferase (GNAT) domain
MNKWVSKEDFLLHLANYSGNSQQFFLSPRWEIPYISAWPKSDAYGFLILPSDDSSQTSSSIAFSSGWRRSRLGFKYRSLGLNETSSAELESVTTEVNGLICSGAKLNLSALTEISNAIDDRNDWDEIRINAISPEEAIAVNQWAKSNGWISYEFTRRETYWIDFHKVQTNAKATEKDTNAQDEYLAGLSSNTRSQLRRARRKIECDHGQLTLEVAKDERQALHFLDNLEIQHRKRWNANGETSGFVNPHFKEFLRDRVSQGTKEGWIEVLKISAGTVDLAYLFNFIDNDRVLFLMSGVNYGENDAYKPGMLAHWLAIEHYKQSEKQIYDFLAGTNRYKQSLANCQEDQVSLVVRRRRWHFVLEQLARQWKRR